MDDRTTLLFPTLLQKSGTGGDGGLLGGGLGIAVMVNSERNLPYNVPEAPSMHACS